MRQYDDNKAITLTPDGHLIHDTHTRKGEITNQPSTMSVQPVTPVIPSTRSPSPTTDKTAPHAHPTPSTVHKSHFHPVHQSSSPHTDQNTHYLTEPLHPSTQHQKNTDTGTEREPGSSQPIHTGIKTGNGHRRGRTGHSGSGGAVWRGCCCCDGFV